MNDVRLRAEEISFAYRRTPHDGRAPMVLEHVDCRIPAGRIIGILGPNGSGKTTLLRLLGGLLQPERGRVLLDGADVRSLSRGAVARRVALVPQETHLAFEYTVLEMTMMGRYPHLGTFALEGPADIAIARAALASTGTDHLEARSFNTLSGGEKQRVVIASALAQRPDVLLLDEPTASLDLAYQLEIRSIVRNLNRQHGLTVVVSTHDLNLAAGLCHELILLNRGRVLAAGPISETLQPDLVGLLYGVEVDISVHPAAGHITVVPLASSARPPRS